MSDEKPESALEAVEAAAGEETGSSPVETQETSQPSNDAEAATEPSGDGTAPLQAEGEGTEQGPIPFNRHKSALENARAKAREEAQAEWDQQYGWAKQVDRQQLEQAQQWYTQLNQDPLRFLRMLQAEVESHPHLGPQLKQPAAFEAPKPTLRSEDGQLVYNVEQLTQVLEHQASQLKAEAAQQFQQLQTQMQSLSQAEQQRTAQAEAQQYSTALLATARKDWPHFKDREKDIQKQLAQMPSTGNVGSDLRDAYIAVLSKQVLPSLSHQAKEEERETAQKKAAAGSTNPSAVAAGAKSRPKNQRELEAWLEKKVSAHS